LKIVDFGLSTSFEPDRCMTTKAGTPYYVAPQVLQGKYDCGCDLWSCGVMMYVLLCGYPPFFGESDADILAKVRLGNYSFNAADWKHISDDAKNLIRALLKMNPRDRYTAEQALNHSWIKSEAQEPADATEHVLVVLATETGQSDRITIRCTGIDGNEIVSHEDGQGVTVCELRAQVAETLKVEASRVQLVLPGGDMFADAADHMPLSTALQDPLAKRSTRLLTKLTGFRAANKLKKATLLVIASELSDVEIKKLRETFLALDTSGDGRLSFRELESGLRDGGLSDIPAELQQIFDAVDLNFNGSIDYSEFLAATLDKRIYIREDVCWSAFRKFDRNGDGQISKEELKQVLCFPEVESALGTTTISKLTAEVDCNGDGFVDFAEFVKMMQT